MCATDMYWIGTPWYVLVKLKVFHYIAWCHYPVHSTTQSADLFVATPTRLLWEAFISAAITRKDYSLKFPPLSIVRYSFISLSELGRLGENENVQVS